MDDLIGLTEFLKTEKGITKLSLEELTYYVQEYELWRQIN